MSETLTKEEECSDGRESFTLPDNIKIEKFKGCYGDGLGIVFNDNTQVLYYEEYGSIWTVNRVNQLDFLKCKCVPCEFEDLKPGDTAYNQIRYFPNPKLNKETEERLISYCNKRDKESLSCYCKILPNKKYCFVVNTEGVYVGNHSNSFDWWRVVPQ